MAESRSNVWIRLSASIPANSTVVVDSEKLTDFTQLEYAVKFREPTLEKNKSLKISVSRDDTLVNDQIYAKQGDPIDIEVNAMSDGIDYSLEFKNNTALGVEATLIKALF